MTSTEPGATRRVVLLALVLVAVNLRTPLTSLPAVVLDIQATTGWGDIALGVLTTLPVVTMGVMALLVPAVAARFGRSRTVWLALGILVIALTLRWAGAIPGVLHVSVVIAGIGIALAAGLVPGIVRAQLHGSIGTATGLWTAAMFLGAGAAAAFTVPLASATGSWQAALALWAIPAALAFIAWGVIERPLTQPPERTRQLGLIQLPWRQAGAWWLTSYMAINSLVFYTAVAWIAPSLEERGFTPQASGWLLGLFTSAQIAGALVLPPLAARIPWRRTLIVITALVTAVCLVLTGFDPAFLTAGVIFLIGMANGGGFAISLSMLSEFAADPAASARLTAMAFSVTYVVAAIGPVVAGTLLEAGGTWPTVYAIIAVVAVVQLVPIIGLRRGTVIN